MNYYFHFPFCRSKCGYCAFYSLPAPSEEAIACWLERILRELKEFEPVETCETIYLGGGTPTLPEPRMLERFFEALYDRLRPGPETEISMEANPETLDREKVVLIRAFVNRLSLGVQSFCPEKRETLGRNCSQQKLDEALELVCNADFPHWNCDLIYAIPGQNREAWRQELRRAASCGIDHLSCYNLTPEEGALLSSQLIPDEEDSAAMWEIAETELAAAGMDMKYLVGTMIEIPRAALTADEIATEAEFFSFGTNDLTQMTFGFSRDDAGKFLGAYYDKKIYENDPFAKLDQVGVGKLVKMAAKMGRETRPDLHLGICGEHGGDPSSVEFCHKVGLDYVSCSPFRVPIARLAAAQAAIEEG